MKIVNLFLTVLFILFAIFQWNDPDPVLWVLVYVFTALVCLQGYFGRGKLYFVIVGIVTFTALAATKAPGMINWLQAGEQSEIFGEMTTDRPYIEDTREFFGLLMALAAVVFNAFLLRKRNKITSST